MRRFFFLLMVFMSMSTWARSEQFYIESIVFEGDTSQNDVLRSTLLLNEGQSYTEEDLRLAVYRLQKLQFVLDVKMRLARGTQRGAYQLIIHIAEMRRLFYVVYSDSTYIENNLFDYVDDDSGQEVDQTRFDPETGITGVTMGYRWFTGRHGELSVFGPANPGVAYTHHNLFNRNVVGSVAFQYPGGFGKNFSVFPEQGLPTRVKSKDALGFTFQLGTQLTPNQRLGFNYKLNSGEISETQTLFAPTIHHQGTNFRNHKSELAWVYDTKDHPLFPVAGSYLKMGVLLDREFRDASNDDPNLAYDRLTANNYYSQISGQTYWEYRPDRTLSLGFLARTGRIDLSADSNDPNFVYPRSYDVHKIGLSLMHGRNLLDVKFFGRDRDFRLEEEVTFDTNRTTVWENVDNEDNWFNRITARLSISTRDEYGLVRLSLVYLSDNEELWQ